MLNSSKINKHFLEEYFFIKYIFFVYDLKYLINFNFWGMDNFRLF
jgi:hypothetical protein